MDIPTVGRIAVIQDPQGAMIAVYTPADVAPRHDGEPATGEFSWHELSTSDYQAAFDFYAALFGWVKGEAMDMGPGGVYIYVWPPGPTTPRWDVQQTTKPTGTTRLLALLCDDRRHPREG